MTPIEQLVNLYGNQSKTAIALKVDRQLVAGWVSQGYIPYRRGSLIEKKTKGLITASQVWQAASRAK